MTLCRAMVSVKYIAIFTHASSTFCLSLLNDYKEVTWSSRLSGMFCLS